MRSLLVFGLCNSIEEHSLDSQFKKISDTKLKAEIKKQNI